MQKLLCTSVLCWLMVSVVVGQIKTESQNLAEWERLKELPVTEENFRSVCDLMQAIGKANLKKSYEMLATYVPKVKASGSQRQTAILLLGWAKAKESTGYFEDAEKLYAEVCRELGYKGPYYRDALAAITLMYGEWGKKDSLNKYVQIGEAECLKAGDKENLSLINTFRAASLREDTTAMRKGFEKAIALSKDLPDKNAYFAALYNYANIYLSSDPLQQIKTFERMLELAKDSSLKRNPPKLYERTTFSVRNPASSVYYQLTQLNLLLTDYDNAWKFATQFYDATVKPNPKGIQAAFFNAELAIVKFYMGDDKSANEYLAKSRTLFNIPEKDIPYLGYFVAAGLSAEHAGKYEQAENYYKKLVGTDYSLGFQILPVELRYAHILTLRNKLPAAAKVFAQFQPSIEVRKFTATGYYYHQFYANYLKAIGNQAGYLNSLETAYQIKDSLISLNRYRAIKEVETRMQVRYKEQQIAQLNGENQQAIAQIRKERIIYGILIALAIITIGLLILYLRYRKIKQAQIEKEHRIAIMQTTIEAGEQERKKIADQLHDDVGTMLALASLNISSTLENGLVPAPATEKLQKSNDILTQVSSDIRQLSHRLAPLAIEQHGFRKAVEDLGYSINLSDKINLEMVILGFESPVPYPLPLQYDLYRIIQELLHNMIKHSKASHSLLELIQHSNFVSILLEDNGIGFSGETNTGGKGIQTIRSKIAYLNGKIEFSANKNAGMLIVMEIPVPENS